MNQFYLILCFVGLAIPNLLTAQKFNYGLEVSPRIIYEEPIIKSRSYEFFRNPNDTDKHFNYYLEGKVYYKLNKIVSVSTGLQIQTDKHDLSRDFLASLACPNMVIEGIATVNRRATYIGIPFQLDFRLGKKSPFYSLLKVTLLKKMNSSETGDIVTCNDTYTRPIKTVGQLYSNYGSNLDIGLGYKCPLFNPNLEAKMELKFGYIETSHRGSVAPFFVKKYRRVYQFGIGGSFGIQF